MRLARDHPSRFRLLANVTQYRGRGKVADLLESMRMRGANPSDVEVLHRPEVQGPFRAAAVEGGRQPQAYTNEATIIWKQPWGVDLSHFPVPVDVFTGDADLFRPFAERLQDAGATLHVFPGGHVSGFVPEVMLLGFLFVHLLPGDPVQLLISPDQLTGPDSAAYLERARQELGLDKPLPVQFLLWARDVLTGNFGMSYAQRVPVTEVIGPRWSATVTLVLSAVVVALAVGVPAGVVSALRQNTWVDYTSATVSMTPRASRSSAQISAVGRTGWWRRVFAAS